jgi:hypothetical protein
MINKEEIEIAINVIESILKLIESIDKEAQDNSVFIALNKAIHVLHKMGL